MLRNLSRLMKIGAFLSDYIITISGGDYNLNILYYATYYIEKTAFSTQRKFNVSILLYRDEQLSSIQNVQLTADNILDKLLHPTAIDKKQHENTKYKPRFEKRDYETIVHQNLNLKQQLNEEKETVSQLCFKLG